jgi:hypothetical protein
LVGTDLDVVADGLHVAGRVVVEEEPIYELGRQLTGKGCLFRARPSNGPLVHEAADPDGAVAGGIVVEVRPVSIVGCRVT